ncbi:MAG: undecaprenyl-diphosphatase UppP [Candidatus Terrybacteria bacterium RIFCSPHIGHO2_01_FULL_48_17]|uniref:Undecaprenyl-diphosphatase n=1 Tax=Candidatus Terrybacteria bacterium RIFCSPHIGHO2_01_FULL_48_17 TaxID=1802362 RepID=A0A1G2PHL8_9BACT|nr:MAG: undecaprenyl-diphosphatase UppP [Candidatus Terrybacteria bacterium RIFCSPHIGHO2_01_FULL_48_17]OHA52255.1 MAG: undecaprenyl-diphosphatase UppP [Candidatus Terrybacteria bacterium RIFCSPLOWO2_01_FULL_48_14]
MNIFIAAILGAVQGLTEFLPVSSTGHLIVAEKWLGVSQERFGLTFDAALHLGTLTAVVLYFWGDIAKLISFDRGVTRLWMLVVVGIVPAGIFGVLFEDAVATVFRSPWAVILGLMGGSIAFVLAEKVGKRARELSSGNTRDALIIGLAQVFSFIPGVSRSGITIAAGLGLGFRRENAARFSFLMAIPLFAAAGLKRLTGIELAALGANDLLFFMIGTIAAAVSGYLVIAFLMRYLAQHSLFPFVWYRFLFAGLIFLFLNK